MGEELKRNVFVVGLDDFHRGELETITNASGLEFHRLLDPDEVTRPDEHDFTTLLQRARAQLESFDGTVDAIIAHWDFPTSVLVPILGSEYDMPAPSLESVLACEHKLWSRLAQRNSIPDAAPEFAGFDPFDDDALASIHLDYPFWIKPVKSFSSQLGFKISSAEDFHEALPDIREHIAGIGDPFNAALAMARLPEEILHDSGNTCLAEQIVSGQQATIEGAMFDGEFSVHGVFDSPKDAQGAHFARYEYPASLPEDIQVRMAATSEEYLRYIGYDNACWNVEFMWDEDADKLWVIEVNTRISQSHSDLLAKVDGMSNHEAAVSVALGVRPMMPEGRGSFEVAGKLFLYTSEMADGIVRGVPSDNEIAALVERFPETKVDITVSVGDRLSELAEQSSYRYDIGTLAAGAQSREELVELHETAMQQLTFDIEPIER